MRVGLISLVLAVTGFGAAGASAQVAAGSLSEPNVSIDQSQTPGSFSALSKRLMPAVVNITTQQLVAPQGLPEFPDGSPLEQFNEFFGRDPDGFSQQGSLGSGFVISSDGLIVTNNHVITGADEINAVFSDGRTLRAQLIGTDEATDIAVLKVEDDEAFAFVEWADSEQAEVGDWVMAIGNPFGFGGSVSVGIVSALSRDIQSGNYDDYIQTDAAINRGNSGGPLFNLRGEVLGVNTAIISPTGGSVGLGFSIPANLARQISRQIIDFGSARRGWFGVNVQPVDAVLAEAYGAPGQTGVIITNINDDGPAASADIEIGDFVLRFDDRNISDVRSLSRIVAETEIGKQVDVEIMRDGRAKTVSLVLGELPGSSPPIEEEAAALPDSALTKNALGIDFTELDEDGRRRYSVPSDVRGVLVRSVSARGPSFGKVQKGDVVVELGFDEVATPTEILIGLDKALRTPQEPVLLRIWRPGRGGGSTLFVPINLED